jgi:hypothetical protein
MHFFFVQVYCGLKCCTSLSENVSLRVPLSNLRDFSQFCVCPSNKHCPSALCAYAANASGKDFDIRALAVGAVSLITFIILNLKWLIIFVQNPNVLCS